MNDRSELWRAINQSVPFAPTSDTEISQRKSAASVQAEQGNVLVPPEPEADDESSGDVSSNQKHRKLADSSPSVITDAGQSDEDVFFEISDELAQAASDPYREENEARLARELGTTVLEQVAFDGHLRVRIDGYGQILAIEVDAEAQRVGALALGKEMVEVINRAQREGERHRRSRRAAHLGEAQHEG
ncbi:hypothetical protein [Spirillospora sp. NPDC047279]|uniref:hypothetical protein n=1 Tax=Spirillospora sp. NPDC047279 TaxID=3155478 RepID=UPI003402F210